ncbi:Uncharacterised protein [Mycobacteroides abscessus subsp. abscessus]|nr:Uncharacterised protein [Mycobacteroides abscessus subsp. abscessus]
MATRQSSGVALAFRRRRYLPIVNGLSRPSFELVDAPPLHRKVISRYFMSHGSP